MTIGCNGWWKCRVGDSRIGRVFKTKFPLIENRKYGHHLLGFNYHHFVTNNASKSHAQEALSDILMMAEFRRRFVGGLWRPLVLFVSQEVSLVYFQGRKSFSTLNLFFFSDLLLPSFFLFISLSSCLFYLLSISGNCFRRFRFWLFAQQENKLYLCQDMLYE